MGARYREDCVFALGVFRGLELVCFEALEKIHDTRSSN